MQVIDAGTALNATGIHTRALELVKTTKRLPHMWLLSTTSSMKDRRRLNATGII